MPTNVDTIIRKLSPAQRKKVEARAAQLIAEEMTLRQLRRARKLTQVRVAKTLGVTQDSVSRLEKRSDLLLSTLRKTVQAMGGNLSLVAEFPDRGPVLLSGIAGDEPQVARGCEGRAKAIPTAEGPSPAPSGHAEEAAHERLSTREREIIQMINAGRTISQIREKLLGDSLEQIRASRLSNRTHKAPRIGSAGMRLR